MGTDWRIALESLSKITVLSNANNEYVTICGHMDDLKCIGIGTDAAVFQPVNAPTYAIKLFAKNKAAKVKVEAEVYKQLGDSPFFPTCFASKDQYLVLSFEEGITLFDCIRQGIHVPKQVIEDVEDARDYVRSKGLNPRDIHLKNILLQNGRAKILDVSEYALPGNDFRWEYLKKGYEQYYHLLDGHPVPLWVLETIRKWFHQRRKVPTYEEVTKKCFIFLYKK